MTAFPLDAFYIPAKPCRHINTGDLLELTINSHPQLNVTDILKICIGFYPYVLPSEMKLLLYGASNTQHYNY